MTTISSPFPKCSGMLWIKERNIQVEDNPIRPQIQEFTQSHVISGECLEMARQIKELFAKQNPNTQVRAKGMLVITTPHGFPALEYTLEYTFGEPLPKKLTPAGDSYWAHFKSYFSFFASYVPTFTPEPDLGGVSYEHLIHFLECANYAPTERGLAKASYEFSMKNPQIIRLL